jgi:thioester reductase-like protein
MTAGTALRQRLAGLVERALQLPHGRLDTDAPLSRYGLDSLAAVELIVAVEQTFGMSVPPALVHGGASVDTVARFIEGDAAVLPRADEELATMLADAVLPADVLPAAQRARPAAPLAARRSAPLPARRSTPLPAGRSAPPFAQRSVPPPASPAVPRAVLVTGATGFLGAWLVDALVRETDARVHCLVRASSDDEAAQRLRRHLDRYGLVDRGLYRSRIHAFAGDITRPQLGLGAREFVRLAAAINDVYHAAAAVNWVSPYSGVRDTNVLATTTLLRLACTMRPSAFHFVSSLSVCYSTTGPREVTEHDDMLPYLPGLHLGYAQSKCVAESLVRQAGARGLPTTIHRPAFIGGDSRSGVANHDDFLAALMKGCIQLGHAPDLDWSIDVVPVEHAAAAIVRMTGPDADRDEALHIANARPRRWRECVLWLRLYGYPLRLEPYTAWLQRLERECTVADNALRPLLPFFRQRHGADALTLPELHEAARRAAVSAARSADALAGQGLHAPALDAALMQRYFDRFVADGFLPAPVGAVVARNGDGPLSAGSAAGLPLRLAPLFEAALARTHATAGHGADGAPPRLLSVTTAALGEEASIVSELTSWRSRRATGLHRCTLEFDAADQTAPQRLDVVLKLKPRDDVVLGVGEELARLCDDAVSTAYTRFRDRIGFTRCHLRELALYAQTDPRFRRHTPMLLALHRDDACDEWLLILEHLHDVVMLNADADPAVWRHTHIMAVLRGLAQLHAVWYERSAELRACDWLGPVRTAAAMAEMTPLWIALADHAAPLFADSAGRRLTAVHGRLARTAAVWWRVMEAQPQTLVHNDFNPRNIALRPQHGGSLRLIAYDWELATLGAPQRDLAELLCFVLPPQHAPALAARYVELYRRALMAATGSAIDGGTWRRGFRAALADLLVDRLAMYALVERCRHQRFLPRVLRTWLALFSRARTGART